MSAFYDQASLVVVPSGYKSGKIYAQKPLTTDGQLTFTRASTATRVNASGLIETVASGVPRLDYLGSTCPKLLLEPQRTNLVTYSEQFDNAAWGSFLSASVTANTTISPDGNQNADTITFDVDPSSLIFQNYISASNTFTISVYAKSSTGKKFCFRNFDGVGVVRSSDFTTTSSWQRFTFTFTSALANVAICNEIGGTAGSIDVWGFQLEAGAYATSYIPTLSTSVTRVVDAATKTSASALIGQTEGTVFWEIQVDTPIAAGHEDLLNIDAGGFGNTIYFFKASNGNLSAEMYASSVAQASFTKTGITAGTHKCAFGYANNNTAFFVNGVQVGTTDTSCSVPAMNRIQLGNGALGPSTGLTKQLLLFKTRLSNSDLAALTA